MSTTKLSNISIAKFEAFLELAECQFKKNEKGHVKYTRADLARPLIFQNHIDPIPEFIIKNLLRLLSYSKDDFIDILNGDKLIIRNGNIFTLVDKQPKTL